MSIELFWRLPVRGDGRSLREDQWHRGDHARIDAKQRAFARTGLRDGYTYYDQLAQVARAAELTGFDGLFIPQSAGGEEPLVVAGSLARETRRLNFVPSLPAPFLSAVYAAKIAVSFQRLSGGRLRWNLVTEPPQPGAWHGRSWSEDEQVARTDEFLDVAKGFWHNKPFTYTGRYYEVENGGFSDALAGQVFPTVYLGGDSEAHLALSAKHADVHVLTLAPLDAVRARIEDLRARAAAQGRTLRFALEADLLVRHSDEAATEELHRLIERADGKTVPLFGNDVGADKSAGDEGEKPRAIGENLWDGFDRFREGAATGLVGGYEQIAARIGAYVQAGVGSFVFGAYPHLEEAYRIGEQLLPLLRNEAEVRSA
jgi:alkanesulfonate monooxygenase